jgi:hypothetical protein
MRVRSRKAAGVAVVAALAAAALPSAAAAVVPTQFIAKTYTEALGRGPSAADWSNSVDYFTRNGCSSATLKSYGKSTLLSAEFASFGYDSVARVIAGYRAALNRDADTSGLTNLVWELDSRTTTWSGAVDKLFDNAEFEALVTRICSATSPDYDFGIGAAVDAPTSGTGFTGTQAALQTALDAARSGTTVTLAGRAVIRLSSPLRVPAGVTLQTVGTPGPSRYAQMARLVRADLFPTFAQPAVVLSPGAKLRSVWVDGQMSDPLRRKESAYNVRTLSGTGTEVSNARLSNPAGATNLAAAGGADTGTACVGNVFTGNLIDAYSSDHAGLSWSNGIAVGCEDATVSGNTVVDASDTGIALRGQAGIAQRSQVQGNTVINAGESAHAAIALDPGRNVGGAGDAAGSSSRSFTGALVRGNTLFNSARAPLSIGIAAGTRAWYGTRALNGSGATVDANSSGAAGLWAQNGIVVSGMLSATVSANTLAPTLVTGPSSCVSAAIGADVSGRQASGTIQTPYTDRPYADCIGDRKRTIVERSGSAHLFAVYDFGTECSLNEGARRLQAMGTRTIKVALYDAARYYKFGACDWSSVPATATPSQIAQTAEYRALFAMEFSSYAMMTYSSLGLDYWLTGVSDAQCALETREMQDLATTLLQSYRGSGKEFVIQNWEGDWAIRGRSRNPDDLPTATAVAGMTRWINCRQAGIEAARTSIASDVKVLQGCEVNLVQRALARLPGTLINDVIPRTDCDLVSYSAWDSVGAAAAGDTAAGKVALTSALDLIASRAPPPDAYTRAALGKAFPRNVYVGEYGWPENATSSAQADYVIRTATETALDWGARWAFYWQLYDNELVDPRLTTRPTNRDVNGYWLIKPDGTRSLAGDYLVDDVWRRVSG